MKNIYRSAGWHGLFKGILPASLNVAVASVVSKKVNSVMQPVVLKVRARAASLPLCSCDYRALSCRFGSLPFAAL